MTSRSRAVLLFVVVLCFGVLLFGGLHRVGLVTAALAHGVAPERAAAFTQGDLEVLPAGERGRVEAEVGEELRRNRYDAFVVRAIARDLALRRGERTKGQPGIRRAA